MSDDDSIRTWEQQFETFCAACRYANVATDRCAQIWDAIERQGEDCLDAIFARYLTNEEVCKVLGFICVAHPEIGEGAMQDTFGDNVTALVFHRYI
jgi:hypothetical protein